MKRIAREPKQKKAELRSMFDPRRRLAKEPSFGGKKHIITNFY